MAGTDKTEMGFLVELERLLALGFGVEMMPFVTERGTEKKVKAVGEKPELMGKKVVIDEKVLVFDATCALAVEFVGGEVGI